MRARVPFLICSRTHLHLSAFLLWIKDVFFCVWRMLLSGCFLREGKFVHMHSPVKVKVIVYTILVPLISATVILHIPVFCYVN